MVVGIVPEGLAEQRADVAATRLFGLSRARVEQAAQKGLLLLDGEVIGKSQRVRVGSVLDITIDQPRAVEVRPNLASGIGIVYDDVDVVVVDKPAGVAAHPSLGWEGSSVVEHLAAAGYDISTPGPPERKGIVSRLDVGTSGLMVVAKTPEAYSSLKRAFTAREVHKVYHGLVQGYLSPHDGVVQAPIAHGKTAEWKMEVSASGREAITHYHVMETAFRSSLVELTLETGRTHQIRVHMASLRHPLVGDLVYGGDPVLAKEISLARQWLHSVELGFSHPRSGQLVSFTSSYPEDLKDSLAILRNRAMS